MGNFFKIYFMNSLEKINPTARETGRFYTHEAVAGNMISTLTGHLSQNLGNKKVVDIVDPFAGDGRLILWFIDKWIALGLPPKKWNITLWDMDERGLKEARNNIDSLRKKGVSLSLQIEKADSFNFSRSFRNKFDLVITNPPWLLIKPDSKKTKEQTEKEKAAYIQQLKDTDEFLSREFPKSQPLRKFAGWGTDLSRVGLELSEFICKEDGIIGIVLPASFYADDKSVGLREHIFENWEVREICYYPAEAKLYDDADVTSCTSILLRGRVKKQTIKLKSYDQDILVRSRSTLRLPLPKLAQNGYSIPLRLGAEATRVLYKLTESFPTWGSLEGLDGDRLWAGRELDESGCKNWLNKEGDGPLFIKGRMVSRYQILEDPSEHIEKIGWTSPVSAKFPRILWRDVSRPSQKRRMVATIINNDYVAGNSLGVAYFRNGDLKVLKCLLGIMNSLCFEFQLRNYLATGHVSLSSVRKVRVPPRNRISNIKGLLPAVSSALKGNSKAEIRIEAIVAKYVYELSKDDLTTILKSFDKLEDRELDFILDAFSELDDEKPSPQRSPITEEI